MNENILLKDTIKDVSNGNYYTLKIERDRVTLMDKPYNYLVKRYIFTRYTFDSILNELTAMLNYKMYFNKDLFFIEGRNLITKEVYELVALYCTLRKKRGINAVKQVHYNSDDTMIYFLKVEFDINNNTDFKHPLK